MNPDTIGCVWTSEFDLNTLRVDGESFESGKKKLPLLVVNLNITGLICIMAATRFFAPAFFVTLSVLLMTKWLETAETPKNIWRSYW